MRYDSFTVNNIIAYITSGIASNDTCNLGNGSIDLTLTGGAAPFTFVWSNGASTEDITGLIAGTYTVTSTDANGCIVMDTVTVNNINTYTTAGAITDDNCGAGIGAIDLTLTGGNAPFTFNWDNGATTEDISGLNAGTYIVTSTDASGCSVTDTFVVVNITTFSYTSILSADSCNLTNGAIDLTLTGGTAPITFAWSNGATTEDISGLSAGSYNVTITDGSGCIDVASFTVNTSSSFASSGAITNDSCGLGMGAVDITTTGGTTPFTFAWSNGATTEDISGLSNGMYTVTITDGSGCSIVDTFTVTNTTTFTAAGVVTDDNCNTGIGAIDISVAGGTAPITFTWSNGATTEDVSSLAGGIYTVTITDASGCSEMQSFTVNNTTTFSYTSAVTNDSCSVGMGAVDLTTTGGTAPFTFTWSNGATTEDITGLSAGMYTVTITDGSGCAAVDSFAIGNTLSFTASGIVSDASCLTCTDGAIDITATGDAPFTFTWSNGATTEDINNLLTGGYSVIVTGASGCSDSLYFFVNYPVGIDAADVSWYVNLYPNPANEEFTLEYNFKTNSKVKFTIYNVIGEIVHDEIIKQTQGKITLDAEFMETGIYFIQLTSEDRRENLKLIIAR